MKVNICICDFNTSLLTNNCIRSIIKNIKSFEYCITIVDNSNRQKFKLDDDICNSNIIIYDNTKQQLFKYRDDLKIKNKGDYKHSKNIQYAMDNSLYDDFLLFDSDTFLHKDIDFVDSNYITSAQLTYKNKKVFTRFLPFVQYFNLK